MDLLTRLLVIFYLRIILLKDFFTADICPRSCPRSNSTSAVKPCTAIINYIDFTIPENKGLRDLIVFGHNGLRNRLAERLNICDMITMFWDQDLSDIAHCYHSSCTTYQQMPCKWHSRKTKLFQFDNFTEKDLAFSMFLWPNYQMENFIERAIFYWYRDHMLLKPPKKVYRGKEGYYQLQHEKNNRFIYIINPPTDALGCSLAKFSSGLSLVCYYLFFLPTMNNSIYLRERPSEYRCPFSYPIRDELFSHLCKYAEYRSEEVT